jgi:hypothetical protein
MLQLAQNKYPTIFYGILQGSPAPQIRKPQTVMGKGYCIINLIKFNHEKTSRFCKRRLELITVNER